MFSKLPLTALRVFESSARLGTFKAAAHELSVTPAAVSHQIKSLESRLGVLLFERGASGVRLTDDGARLFRVCHDALLDLSRGLDTVRPAPAERTLVLTTTPAFAAMWLIPRLGRFRQVDPQLHIKVETGNALVDLERDARVDLAIRATSRDFPALFEHALIDEYFGAYAAAGFDAHRADGPPDLIEIAWETAAPMAVNWQSWCRAAGRTAWLPRAVFRHYDDEHYALQAVLHGQGIVLASSVLVAEHVERGALVPIEPSVRLGGARYVALCRPGRERQPQVRRFLDWLDGELAHTRAAIARMTDGGPA
ncbi:LysR family transcriptional regulator [Burkholderia stagnalis]|uniref:LysR family transcriptional regulator n=1 Tax=Burkholderia stagnalis TaxID=1503054 RepID=A0A6L3MPW8_9BURK|nr:LysR substrate-binding domain-containing protein [Burkholderia stagnalis]KAB0633499.1 LysR family transcriptional regulator [Burkholderia stagnalis]KVL97273.1 LysR family transcriptional regulator [Burkholderia stagnalis]KVL99714.1 LysR family transcriptional regulator [Burkholderia stagnalis]KVM10366.1 LysR family transcriptional regulator [Burkholderia stagnalis]KVO50607.1 LysR family transcriptional regulator [Burkholderia stagnalis]